MKKTKKIILSFLAGFALVILVSCGSKADKKETAKPKQEVIKVGISNSLVPFGYMDGNKVVGAEVDIWREIGKRTNKKIEFDPVGFDVLFGKLDNKEVDFIASYIAINPTRKKNYNFTEPYAHGFMKLLVLNKTKNIKGLQDCNNKKVAVTATSNAREFLERYNKEKNKNVEITVFENSEAAMNALNTGDVVGYFEGAGVTIRFIKEGMVDGKFVGKSEDITDTAFPYRKDKDAKVLGEKVSEAIKSMKKDGTLKKIYKKWIGVDITDSNADMSYMKK